MADKIFDVGIVGGGLAGLTAALALARSSNASITLVAPGSVAKDRRTTALLIHSVELLRDLGVWKTCSKRASTLSTMRIIDGTKRLIRAQPVDFRAAELGLEAFGYNIPNSTLSKVLRSEIAGEENIVVHDAFFKDASIQDDRVSLGLDNGETFSCRLAIAADGRRSKLREIAGIGTGVWDYRQAALVLTFRHKLPHENISTEFHTETGPFTQVPLPPIADAKHRSSLVWATHPHEAETLLEAADEELNRKIETQMQSCLGPVEIECRPVSFPLSGMQASRSAANRIALVGEAAHVFPPIGAQGFNLGLRDVEEITSTTSAALSAGRDPGSGAVLDRYARNRRMDITFRAGAVDALNRSLLTGFLPVQAGRALGLEVLSRNSFLRRLVMRHGVSSRISADGHQAV